MSATDTTPSIYRGRFAPTPSGPLHFGSLIAAVGSYLQARRVGGEWWLRIEDLDPPRVVPGAADAILRTLEAFGFTWDGPVLYQSQRSEAYREALETLRRADAVYRCTCSRREIAARAALGPAGPIYPGTCRSGHDPGRSQYSWRLRTAGARIAFVDAVQGPVAMDIEAELGDFVVLRADGVFAYHLALVVDDAASGITHVVRGRDLLACTAPQIYLQRQLGLPQPRYLHLPIAVNTLGQKLSKQTHAPALDAARAVPLLARALAFLGHPPPAEAQDSLAALWRWARANWDPARIPAAVAAPPLD